MRVQKSGKKILNLVKPVVRKLAAYHVDETPVRIKLDAMENPFPLPPAERKTLSSVLANAALNRYPDPSAKALKKSIAIYWNMDPKTMLLGNGSDELIQSVILAFGGPVLVPLPTFAMYEITSRALGEEVITVPLDDSFELDADLMLRKEKETGAKIIFLACPNNPTGNRFSEKAVRKILEKSRCAVVIDEAYFSFSGKSYLKDLPKFPNVILLRTLSKIGLAGLRVGVLSADPAIVAELNKIRLPYNINALSQAAGIEVLKRKDVLNRQISLLISERESLYNDLRAIQGVQTYPSETNFIMFRTSTDASAVHAKLKQKGILIKNLNKPGPLKNCLRVTIGTPEENRMFLKAITAALK